MRWWAELVAVIAPPACVTCGCAMARAGERLCAECALAVPWLRPGCARCGLPVHRGGACPAAPLAFERSWAPVAYEGVSRQLVGALKFRGALPVANVMAAHMAANLPPWLRDAEASLVPVPAMSARTRRRGFDPARELTTALARRIELPVTDCLVRRDRSGRQVGASRALRRSAGRFDVRVRGAPPAVAILVDDVHTTGATLDACARALADDGRATVLAAVSYARTL